MQNFLEVPASFGPAVLGALIAAAGYVAKLLLEWIAEVRRRIRERRTRLAKLFSLLSAGQVAYEVQSNIRNRLADSIKARIQSLKDVKGFERLFTATYPDMTHDQRQLHTIIRVYTEHTIRPLNESILQWLQEDTYFMAKMGAWGAKGKLAGRLAHLEAHLLLWQAKYKIWIPRVPSHALVYLADEEEHGLGFPTGIEEDVLAVIGRRSLREWKERREAAREEVILGGIDSEILEEYEKAQRQLGESSSSE